MKTLIIFNHPHEGSFCSAIREAVCNGLKKGGHEHKIIDLDKDGFNPVMREKDRKAFVQAGRIGEDGLDGTESGGSMSGGCADANGRRDTWGNLWD